MVINESNYKSEEESTDHIFLCCEKASSLWHLQFSLFGMGTSLLGERDLIVLTWELSCQNA